MSDLISRADAIEAIASLDETDGTVKVFTGRQVNEILSALPSAETPTESTNTPTDTPTVLISKEDAIDTICKEWCYVTFANCPHADDGFRCDGCDDVEAINALPSAEAEPTVIRSRTLMPTKDFKEWAKRIRETNPNAVVIPCDAEVVSAEAVQVVRCKDCVYFHNGDCYNGNFPIKGDLANVYFDMKETDFCSYGERKGGDSE